MDGRGPPGIPAAWAVVGPEPEPFDPPLPPPFEPEPAAGPAAAVPTPEHGRTLNRGKGRRARSVQAAANVPERAPPARPSPASASSAATAPPSATRCRVTADHVAPEDGADERGSNTAAVARAAAGEVVPLSSASGERSFTHPTARGEGARRCVVASIRGVATDPDAAVVCPCHPATIKGEVGAASSAGAPTAPLLVADVGAAVTPARVWRDPLEPIVAETPFCCEPAASTTAVGASVTAGAVTEAEATGAETLTAGCGPTTTVALAAGLPGSETVAVTDAVGGETAGVVTTGVVTAGVVTDGVVTAGAVTAGVVTAGVVTAGVVTDGVVTAGAVTAGVVTAGVVTLPREGPSASAPPASAPHAKKTNAAAAEALRRTTPLMSQSIPRPAGFKQSGLGYCSEGEANS